MLKVLGLLVLVVLILVGALMPLKYMSRMHLPRRKAHRVDNEDGDRGSGES